MQVFHLIMIEHRFHHIRKYFCYNVVSRFQHHSIKTVQHLISYTVFQLSPLKNSPIHRGCSEFRAKVHRQRRCGREGVTRTREFGERGQKNGERVNREAEIVANVRRGGGVPGGPEGADTWSLTHTCCIHATKGSALMGKPALHENGARRQYHICVRGKNDFSRSLKPERNVFSIPIRTISTPTAWLDQDSYSSVAAG